MGGWFKRSPTENKAAEFGRDARFDWQIMCFAFLLLNLISLGVGVVVYQKINKGEIFLLHKQETSAPGALDRFLLEKTVAFFERKKTRFEELQQKPLQTVDPFVPSIVPKR